MLNEHSQLYIPAESLFMIDYLRYGDRVPPERLKRLLHAEPLLQEWNQLRMSDCAAAGTAAAQLLDGLHMANMRKQGKRHWGQKTPRFIREADLLKRSWPDVKFVHMVRDPRAVVYSFKMSLRHTSNVVSALARWVRDNECGLEIERKYPTDYCRIRYEDLCEAPAAVLQEVCRFLGIPYEPRVLEYHRKGPTDLSAFRQVAHRNLGSEVQRSHMSKWAGNLAAWEVHYIQARAGRLMQIFDYRPVAIPECCQPSGLSMALLRARIPIDTIPVLVRLAVSWPRRLTYPCLRKTVFAWYLRSLAPLIDISSIVR